MKRVPIPPSISTQLSARVAPVCGYAQMGVPLEYLIAASFMAAPGGLLFAKIIVPETEKPDDNPAHDSQSADADKPANVLDAAASGAASGMQLALNVGAMLLAFIALIALLNDLVPPYLSAD